MSMKLNIVDTTLRDGAQTQGVDFTVADKAAIARELDRLGIDYIEGGWPGANPTDDRFFADPPEFQNAKFVAFGMTRRAGRSAANDPGLAALLPAGHEAVGAAYRFTLPPEGIEPLIQTLLAQGHGIAGLSLDRPGLHDAFVRIVNQANAEVQA